MYLIDTNIFLEVMLSQSRREECRRLLRMLRDGTVTGAITDFSVHSMIVLLGNLKRLEELRRLLLSLTAYKGLYVYATSIAEEVKAVETAARGKLDVDDALQYTAAQSINAEAMVSFDRDFDGLEIPRKEPSQITC